jgi:diadenosine tetraphosphate (Ap4A) HIT family hydrolase
MLLVRPAGGLVRRLGAALEAVTGCVKTYLMQFSEAEGFSHLHLHLVPRLPDHPDDARGPRVFADMTDDQAQWLPATERHHRTRCPAALA